MNPMLRRSIFSLSILVAVVGLFAGSCLLQAQNTPSRGRKFKAPPPTARVEVTVLRDANGKPIENASVIFRLVSEKGAMELKSNEDGKSVIDVLPVGATMRLQILVKGYQTYGADYVLDKPDLALEIRMKRPGEQYSIYKTHDLEAESSKGRVVPTAPKTDEPK